MSTPFLSIIIPAHNEEQRLPLTLEQVFNFLWSQPYSAEVLVVENGSTDQTAGVVREFARQIASQAVNSSQITTPQLRLIQIKTRGKGLAVKAGILEARGEYRFMCDADLSMPIDEINRFLPPALTDFDIAIASREAPGAQRFAEPAYRHLVGRVFNTLIRLIALPELQDTQCGFKCFRDVIAEDLFRRLMITGWSFDVEALFIARRKGYRIVEIPIPWYFNPHSHIHVLKDSFQMAFDLLKIRLNGLLGKYEQPV